MPRSTKASIPCLKRIRTIAWIGILLVAAISCGDDQNGRNEPVKSRPAAETFTFFDLGRNSRFTESLRGRLSETLGNDAIEHRSIIDLTINSTEFLKRHLPELYELNRGLNDPPGERVDHDVIKLMYRYARKKNTPFDAIELMFSGASRLPILFRIRFREDEAGTLAALKSKYGEPQVIPWDAESGKSLVWRKDKDIMVFSFVPDQFGQPEYRIAIHFVDELADMVAREREQRRLEDQKRNRAVKKAF